MKVIITLFILTFSSQSFSFTLNNNFGAAFKNDKVKVSVAGNTTCTGITPEELKSLIKPSISDFWNSVSTSALRLKDGGFSDSIANIQSGFLCPPTDATCIAQGTVNPPKGVIPPVSDIIIACNNNAANFANSSNVLAVTVPNNFSKDKIVGAVILINDTSNAFYSLSRNEQISVIAHEIGHAIGLGHSENQAALMYYRTVDMREKLGQDDVDGVSYLYPVKMDGCGLFGTIEETKTPPFFTTLGALVLMILLSELARLFKRAKARASL